LSNEPRKATDVLLELETKIDMLLGMLRNQDLNIKVLSNKLNELISNKTVVGANQSPKVTIEAVNTAFTMVPEPKQQVPILSEEKIPIDGNPKGFRRTSRPETYSGDNSYLPKKTDPKFPVQMPMPVAEAIVPKEALSKAPPVEQPKENIHINTIPVQQRVVDKNGKSVFLADVVIIKSTNGEKVFKGKTNGTGKWMAALTPDTYKVLISKRESLTKERSDFVQEIIVDGKTTPLDLQTLIFK
jgi:hypothetical protein